MKCDGPVTTNYEEPVRKMVTLGTKNTKDAHISKVQNLVNSNVFPFGRWLLSKPEDLGSNPLMGNFTEYLLALFTFYWIEKMKIEMMKSVNKNDLTRFNACFFV